MNHRRLLQSTVLAMLAWSAPPAMADTMPPLDTIPFVEIESPAGPASQAPGLVSGKDAIYLTWIESPAGGVPVLKMSRHDAAGWSASRTIVSDPKMMVNWADVPKLLALDDGTLIVSWLRRSGDAAGAYDVEVLRSSDKGATWTSLGRPYRDKAQAEHGFVSLLPHAGTGFWIVWLDGRNYAKLKPAPASGGHGHGADTELRAARWRDGKFEPEVRLDTRVCDCCQTAAVTTLEGLAVAYRDRDAGETRDISLVRYERQVWSKPFQVRHDGWKIDGCPVNGPAMASHDRNLAMAWYTDARETSEVFVALSDSSSFGLSRIVKVDDGRPLGRVDVDWLRDESAMVTWLEQTSDSTAQVRVRQVTMTGEASPAKTLATTTSGRGSGFPQLAVRDIDIWVAWTDASAGSHQVRLGKLDLESTK
ncbi:MAG: hypothetical protein SGI90_13690 [Candidatus Eisenbacteria bacterium]|nr:hypothetical protein [Candidatus Eisenbacteria bacterium]